MGCRALTTAASQHAKDTSGGRRAPEVRRRASVPGVAGNQAHLRRLGAKGQPLQAKLTIGAVDDPLEREADAAADRVMRMADPQVPLSPAGPALNRKCAACEEEEKPVMPEAAVPAMAGEAAPSVVHQVLDAPGRALDPATHGFMASRFGADFSDVRIHTDGRAAESAAAVSAHAYTVGSHVVFGAGQFDTASAGGRRLIAHELAHTLQAGAGGRIARKTLTDLPEATRKGLRVSRNAPAQTQVDGWVSTYFDPKAGVHADPAADVEFGAEITDAQQQKGLKGAAHDLASMATVLPVGTIVEVAIDLRPQGGPNAVFRFARYLDGTAEKILIEQTQILPAAPAAAAGQQATGVVTVGAIKVDIAPGFSADQAGQVVGALGLLPAPILAKADGVKFTFVGSGTGPGNEAGEYQAEKDTILIWGDMFNATARRIGTATDAQAGIVHELGHMIDLRPLFGAQIARDKATETRKKLQSQLDHPTIDLNDPDPLAGTGDTKSASQLAEEKKLKDAIAVAQKEIDTQNAAMATAKSLSGDELGEKKDSEQLLTDFGKALASDGIKAVPNARKTNRKVDADNQKAKAFNDANPTAPQKPIAAPVKTLSGDVTDYADTDLMEAYAENFSLYTLDESLLQAIRPATFAFFQKALPKKPPPAAATGAKP